MFSKALIIDLVRLIIIAYLTIPPGSINIFLTPSSPLTLAMTIRLAKERKELALLIAATATKVQVLTLRSITSPIFFWLLRADCRLVKVV